MRLAEKPGPIFLRRRGVICRFWLLSLRLRKGGRSRADQREDDDRRAGSASYNHFTLPLGAGSGAGGVGGALGAAAPSMTRGRAERTNAPSALPVKLTS